MVVKMMKWRSWSPNSSKNFEAKIVVHRLQFSSENTTSSAVDGGHWDRRDFSKLGVEVKWKGCVKSNNRINFKRNNVKRDLTKVESLNDDGTVEWNEEFVGVCDLLGLKDGFFHQWEVAFKVFDGSNQSPKRCNLGVASGSLNLAEFVSDEQENTPISIHLLVHNNSMDRSPILSISLSLLELRTAHNVTELAQRSINGYEPTSLKSGFKKVKIFKAISVKRAKKASHEEEGSEGKNSVRSNGSDYPFDTDSFDGSDGIDSEEIDYSDSNIKKSLSYETLAYANHAGGSITEDRIYFNKNYKMKKTDGVNENTIDRSETQILKRSIFPWRKRKLTFKSPKVKGEPLLKRDIGEEGGDDIDFDRRMLTLSDNSSHGWQRSDEGSTASRSSTEFGDDTFIVGKWENKEIISRDEHMKLETQVFFASIDQRSQRASGQSACTSLVATIANWFQNNRHQLPIKSELDTLIREGSLEWRNLCENEIYKKHFPDKHFDLETVLQAQTRDFVVVPEKSFIGFFQLEEGVFDFLDGAMSFDAIWDEISQTGQTGSDPLVYIVSWNDHFFILKVEKDAYFIIDTLGERLYEGCDQAYILKFDQNTSIQQKSNEILVSQGKESCKEYIKSFLAAIPLRELQTDVKKGLLAASSPIVHHRLQFEFHYTKCL